LAGVAPDESAPVRRVGRAFEWVLIPLALWLPVQWSLEGSHQIDAHVANLLGWLVWGVFVAEATVLGWLVQHKARYFRSNWLNLLIIVFGVPILWAGSPWATLARAARLLMMVSLLANVANIVQRMLSMNRLGPILGAIVIVTTLGGLIIGYFDPAFSRPLDGIWWAWVTVTTVGYGDLVPQTPAARMFAIALMILGVSMIALLSASLVSYFQAEEEREAARVRRLIWSKLQQIESEADDRARHNEAMLNRLAAIELALVRAVEHRSLLEQKIERLLDRWERDETAAGTEPRTGDDDGIEPTAPRR
jgi:voltage-gated potassium channel